MEQTRPFLKWIGGKSRLIPQMRNYLPTLIDINTYYEPFVGGGALFFYLSPASSVINDVNANLIRAYRTVKDKPNELITFVKKLEYDYLKRGEDNRRIYYYKIRDEFNNGVSSEIKKTAYLIFLNATGYNGMYRENSQGEYNIPFGKYHRPRSLDEDNLLNVSKLLQKTRILNTDYSQAVKDAKRGDFVYLDPPYYPLSETSHFTKYNGNHFSETDHIRLKDTFCDLVNRGCKVLLSNSDTSFIRKIYKDYRKEKIQASRSVNCKAKGRGKITELLIMGG